MKSSFINIGLNLILICSVGLWVESIKLDTADTGSWDGSDLDVSLVSPRSGPGVSNDVVVLSTLGSVSNGSDGVVELGSALSRVEDTTRVHLEDGFVSLNGDGSWLLGDGGLELINRSSGNVGVGGDLNLSVSLVNMAVAASWGDIWVGGLGILLVSLKIGEGVGLPSTVATI